MIHNCVKSQKTDMLLKNESDLFLIKGKSVLPCCSTHSVTVIKTAFRSEKAILRSVTRLLNPAEG